GLLLGCALISSPQTASTMQPMPSLRAATWEGALLSSHTNLTLPLPKVIKVQSNQAGETPKGGGLMGSVERLWDRVKRHKQSPPGPPEPSPPPTSGSLPGSMT